MKHYDISNTKINLSRLGRLALILICLTQSYCSISDLGSITDIAILPSIKDFAAVSENEAWLVIQSGKVFHFTDGGQVKTEVKFETKVVKIYFLNVNEGWALGENGQLWATTNNGKDWIKRAIWTEENPAGLSDELVFADRQVGWLVSAFSIWMTQDGGFSWSMVYPTEQFGYSSLNGQPISISLVNSEVAWFGFSNGAVLRTTNRGKTWEKVTTPGKFDLRAIYGFSVNECLVSAWNRGGLFHTTDGGKSWTQVMDTQFREISGMNSISFIDKQIGWAAGLTFVTDVNSPKRDLDILFKTTNGGKTWKKVETGIKGADSFTEVKFTDEKNGWLLGERTIYRSSDGGSSWVEIIKVEDANRHNN